MSEPKPTNALVHAASSYLRSAAHQPVQWNEWGDAAFEAARRDDKPILLDIGAVWCHWCHVMDRESYESEEVARVINENYVAVKVDRDERPDIDARYQMAVSALTGQGGWPLTAFLTPDGKPFYGGTYFPPDDRYGRPGMKHVLESIAHNYRTHKAEILNSAEGIHQALGSVELYRSDGEKAGAAIVGSVVQNIAGMFDPEHGGFGSSPKFPHPSALDLLIDAYLETRQNRLLDMVSTTLEHMGRGGVYDQVGGGFHRYSVDERWIVPHFEKMSYDNAGLLGNYLRAYQITGNEFFREIALGILSFIETVLSAPDGGFYASQDADYSLDDDGDYFTWTLDELKAALSETEAAAAAEYYHVEPQGEMHHNPAKNVLFIDQPFEAIAARLKLSVDEVKTVLARAKGKLLEARRKRPTPYVDTTIYAGWNGMTISTLLEAYKVLGLEGARDRALLTLDLLLAQAYDPAKGVAHALLASPAVGSDRIGYRVSNFDLLEDQVFVATALLDAFEVTGSRLYYDRALELAETTVRRFWDGQGGGFFDTARDAAARQGTLSMTRKAFQDSPTPAGNPVAALVLDRLAQLAERPDFRDKAGTTLDLLASKAAEYGLFAATYALALVNHFRPPVEVVVVGSSADPRTRELTKTAYQTPRAGKRVLAFEPEVVKEGSLPPGLASTLPHLPLDGNPVALVCVGTSCQPPVSSSDALRSAIEAR
ncbi:MAG TPA: thioredoxin domain-containing protein [Terriglobia bacterium]|nr:thioredoxin domain-containing protein [Terriglobia bacterium]